MEICKRGEFHVYHKYSFIYEDYAFINGVKFEKGGLLVVSGDYLLQKVTLMLTLLMQVRMEMMSAVWMKICFFQI